MAILTFFHQIRFVGAWSLRQGPTQGNLYRIYTPAGTKNHERFELSKKNTREMLVIHMDNFSLDIYVCKCFFKLNI